MNFKLQNQIIKSNQSIWKEKKFPKIAKKGLYEVYFLIFHDSQHKESYWIRYTLICNKKSSKGQNQPSSNENGQGLLWFGYFNSLDNEKNFMSKKHFPLSEVKGSCTKDNEYIFISIENAILSLSNCIGSFTTKTGKVFSWDLKLTNFQEPYIIVPKIAQKLRITNTINIATHPHIDVSGKLLMNGEERQFNALPGVQYHTYADKYSVPWEWFSCYTIKDWNLGYIDFSYKVDKGILEINNGKKRLTAWNKNFIKKLLTSRKLNRNRSVDSLTFTLEKKEMIIEGSITVPKESILGIEYVGPTGEKFYCYNSEIASGTFKIFKSVKGMNKNEVKELTIKDSIAFETTYTEPIKNVRFMSWDEEEFWNNTNN